MIKLLPLTQITLSDLQRIASGYSSDAKYAVTYTDSENHVSFNLQPVLLDKPYTKQYDHYDEETLELYNRALGDGYSFGAYDGDLLAGLIIAEPRRWNLSIWVWEFHVAESYCHRGIGKRSMESVAEKASKEGFRTIVCETQNTNSNAIIIYRKLGFRMEGVDISYYTNEDYPNGETAVFMKRRL
jgi:streptothricin acetyltransferase